MPTIVFMASLRIFDCLILCDSRGRDLDDYIKSSDVLTNLPNCQINVEVRTRPGITLNSLDRKLHNITRGKTYDFIIIFAGICSFTRAHKDGTINLLVYEGENKPELALEIINKWLTKYGNRIHIATIPPADINKFNVLKNEDWTITDQYKEQQNKLVRDIERVNDQIIESNIIRDQPTILTAKQTYYSATRKDRKTGKKSKIKKFTAKELTDGVHANDKLKDSWFERIVFFLHKIIQAQLKNEEHGTDSETSSTDSDRPPAPKRRRVVLKNICN